MSTSEVPNVDPVLPTLSSTSTTCTSTAPTSVASGTKRKHEMDIDSHDSEPGMAHDGRSENVPEEVWQEQTTHHTHSQSKCCELEETNPPRSKRRLSTASSLQYDSQPLPQAWSQDPLFTYSQYSDDEFCLNNLKNISSTDLSGSEPCHSNSLKSEMDYCDRMYLESKTSTQIYKNSDSSEEQSDKENSIFSSSLSPSKNSILLPIEHFSNPKWTEPKSASHLKHIPANLWNKTDKHESFDSQCKWPKPNISPIKKSQLSCKSVDEGSLSMMFTQDSEGFQVIAHRCLPARTPLKDQSNIITGTARTTAYKSVVEEDEMLFTQDSQGNLVISHRN